MEQLPALGKAIKQIVFPTRNVFEPLLLENAAAIRSTERKTFTYGPHDRQQLDVYYPSNSTDSPVLIILYGGGLIRGARTLPGYADGLAHANLGHFFATQLGYTVVVPDYRLIEHGGKFPSGGEDVSLAIDWIRTNLGNSSDVPRDLFIMGNSAGGIHMSTFIFGPTFSEQRQKLLKAARESLRLRAIVELSVPFNFDTAEASRAESLTAYFGDRIAADCPLGLLKAARQHPIGLDIFPDVRIFVLTGRLDPEDEILIPNKHFVEEWEKVEPPERRAALVVGMMAGHNHISPFLSLGTGKKDAEAWGYQVGAFFDSARKTE